MPNLGMFFSIEVGVWLNLRRMDWCAFMLILRFDVIRTIARRTMRWSNDHETRRRFDRSVLESGWYRPREGGRLDRSRGDLANSDERPFQSLSSRTSLHARSGSEMPRKTPAIVPGDPTSTCDRLEPRLAVGLLVS